ncbi:hypothetical protein SDJN02_18072, partial [Cucurbita argyrosperma subsp. argyrosperma]
MASGSGDRSSLDPASSDDSEKPPTEAIRIPTVEEIRGQDIWNNGAVRSVVSGVIGFVQEI